MDDKAVRAGDAIEATLSGRIAEVYQKALERAVKNNRRFLTNVKQLDERAEKLKAQGWETKKIDAWRKEEMMRLLREQRVVQNIAEEMNRAGIEIAPEIKKRMADIYKVNSDMMFSRLNDSTNINFTLVPRRQVEIILDDTQSVFSKLAYQHLGQNRVIRQRLQSELAQATLLGESQEKLIARIQKVTGMAEYQARRVAQTERTRVQSQARADALHEAAGMGITVTKRWSTRMVRSRDSHIALNGVEIPENEKFVTIWGNTLDYPGDPSAPAREVVNCHCVLVPDVKTSKETASRQTETVPTEEMLAGAKRGKPMTFAEADDYHVNPNYGADPGYSINCQSCVPTFEARLRGFNVEALPNRRGSASEALSRQTNLIWIDKETGEHPKYISDRNAQSPRKYLAFIRETVKPGERYSIEFTWKGRISSGHIVNLDRNENGELRIKDNQRGKGEKSEWAGDEQVLEYLRKIKYNATLYGNKYPTVPKLLRLDTLEFDKEFAEKIMKAVE